MLCFGSIWRILLCFKLPKCFTKSSNQPLYVVLIWGCLSFWTQPSSHRDEVQLEVARLLVGLPGDGRMRDMFALGPHGLLNFSVKEKQAHAMTVLDKCDVHLTEAQSHAVELVLSRLLSYLGERLPAKYPVILDTATESYQWLLFAAQFMLIDERKKKIVLDHYTGLRQLLMAQLTPVVRPGGNRQVGLLLLLNFQK